MTDSTWFQRTFDKLARPRMTQKFAEDATYICGSQRIPIKLRIADARVLEETNDGITVRANATSFLIDPDELRLSGRKIPPKRGHQVLRKSGELVTVLPGEHDDYSEWSDGHRNYYLIHTEIDEQGK